MHMLGDSDSWHLAAVADSCMHGRREEVQSVEGQRTLLRAAAKQAEAAAEACFQDEQLRRVEAMPEVNRPWTIAALSITPQAAVRSCPCALAPSTSLPPCLTKGMPWPAGKPLTGEAGRNSNTDIHQQAMPVPHQSPEAGLY